MKHLLMVALVALGWTVHPLMQMAQAGDGVVDVVVKSDKARVQLTRQEQERLTKVLARKEIKPEYELVTFEDLRGVNSLRLDFGQKGLRTLHRKSMTSDIFGNTSYVYTGGLGLNAVFTVHGPKMYAWAQCDAEVITIEPLGSKYHVLTRIDNSRCGPENSPANLPSSKIAARLVLIR